jgi:excisionase family DNA binding protein
MTIEDPPAFVSLDEAALLLGVSSRTFRRRVADGSVPAYRVGPPGSRVRLRVDELLAWLEGEDGS